MKNCPKCQFSYMLCTCRPAWDLAWGPAPKFKIYEIRNCPQCDKKFGVPMKERDRVCCSRQCFAKYNWKNVSAAIRSPEAIIKGADARRGSGNRTKYIKRGGKHEHRVVAEQMLGRPLLPGEIVHHKDENGWNNSPDNLEVLPSQAEHARIHCIKRWSTGTKK